MERSNSYTQKYISGGEIVPFFAFDQEARTAPPIAYFPPHNIQHIKRFSFYLERK
jgi:hypothetical protein